MGMTENVWVKLEIPTPPELVEAIYGFFEDAGIQGCYQENLVDCEEGDVCEEPSESSIIVFIPKDVRHEKTIAALRGHLDELREIFQLAAPIDFSSQIVQNPNWNEEWKKYFKPLRIGRNIVIKPSWERFDAAAGDILIEIDPGMAFGTGQHASTRLCLEAMEYLITSQHHTTWRMLDVGTGTGILSIYGVKAGIHGVAAIDVDRDATAIAQENAAVNKVAGDIAFRILGIDGISDSFNLIVANLTSKILVANSRDFMRILEPEGFLIISGIIKKSACEIERAFGLDLSNVCQKVISDGWVCYTIQKRM